METKDVITIDTLAARIGQPLGVSDWFTVDQASVNCFADVSHDRQFIHTDPAAAALTPFGGTIAHGFFSLALLSAMFETALPPINGVTMAMNYGFDTVRFLSPVRTGKRVRGRFALKSLNERNPGQWLMALDVTVEIEGESRPALVAHWIALCFVDNPEEKSVGMRNSG